ncbi:MAG TPA: ketoacyl-ACP synthase III [Nitrospinaceae bacterium]|nr:ketoacyl-ACP synthase III [Nitrospinaceae bacterium]
MNLQATITAIEYHLPSEELTNEDLCALFPDWSMDKIEKKTGIRTRHISGPDEFASDLAATAAQKLFASGACKPQDIDFILFCTQSPEFLLPTTACLIQDQLGIPCTAGALDFNLGCTGFIYGLSLAKGLIETSQATNILLLTGETYSKFIHPEDRSVRTLFGDGAAATLVQGKETSKSTPNEGIGPFIFGTDGGGGQNLKAECGGVRSIKLSKSDLPSEEPSKENYLYMNGPEIFNFTLKVVPQCVHELLSKSRLTLKDIDLFVFHQANAHVLEHLRDKLNIDKSKFLLVLEHVGNTVSSTIPIALKEALSSQKLNPGQRIMLVGFGVGYSWASNLVHWFHNE